MAAGFDLAATTLRQTAASLAQRWFQLLPVTQQTIQRLNDYSPTLIEATYEASYGADPDAATKGAADAAQLAGGLAGMTDTIVFCTRASSTLTRTDNTAGTAAETVTLPAGAYCLYSTDPTDIAQMKSLGTDKSPGIRALAPFPTMYGG